MKVQKFQTALIAFLVSIAVSSSVYSQVCATPGLSGPNAGLSGTLNSYYPGTGATVNTGTTSIPVGSIDTTSGGSSTAIATGDLLIVMQMQGAQINSSNSDCYGDGAGTAGCATRLVTTGNYAGGNTATNYLAGNWEYCTAVGPVAAGSVAVRCAGGAGTVNAYSATAATASFWPAKLELFFRMTFFLGWDLPLPPLPRWSTHLSFSIPCFCSNLVIVLFQLELRCYSKVEEPADRIG